MLYTGLYQTLTVSRISEHGLYLSDEEGAEVLLPNRYVSLEDKVGDKIEVFVYHDTLNRLTATRERPMATIGEVAALECVDKNVHGAFLNWGITAKDLFVPNREQNFPMEIGRRYVVYLYRDVVTDRVVATARLAKHIGNSEIVVREREDVEIVVAQRIERGFRVVINNRNWGVVYDNQLFEPLHIGDKRRGYISRVTDERRIDVMLRQQGYDEVRSSAVRLAALAQQNDGILPLSDNSSPEEIKQRAQMSKKVFKKALGYLMSHGATRQTERGLEIIGQMEQLSNEQKSVEQKSTNTAPKSPQRAESADRRERRAERKEQSDRTIRKEHTERPERKERQQRTDRAERTERTERTEKPAAVSHKTRTEREGNRHAYTKFLRTKSE